LPLIAVVLLAGLAYYAFGHGGISLEALVRHRMAIEAFVAGHRVLAVLAFIAIYIAAVALSVPGALFLTMTGGFLFGLVVGATAATIGATAGATLIFLVARTALGEPLLRRVGPRASQLAKGFRDDAFSYLLFLRLVPAFPFFLVNLVPAFAGVWLGTFVGATALGIIPATFVYAFAGTGHGAEEFLSGLPCLRPLRLQPDIRRHGRVDAAAHRRTGRARPARPGTGGREKTACAPQRGVIICVACRKH
jgi:uncharacterized membrane protein YdjX (TVP38/TMEM64 family)